MSDAEKEIRSFGGSEEESLDSESEDESAEGDTEAQLEEPVSDEVTTLALGQQFYSMKELKDAIFRYSVSAKMDLQYKKSETDRLTAICNFNGCPWRLHASVHSGTKRFTIKVLIDEHRCTNTEKNKLFKIPRIVETFIEAVRENPGLKPIQMRAHMLTEYNVRVSLPQCKTAKTKCLRLLKNDHVEQFRRLWDYTAELKRANPGSTVVLETESNTFQRIYIMLGALKEGWRWCRAVIHLDGAFLKWQMKGEVLSAVCRDANDQLYPIAWAVVDVENKKNWTWFIKLLIEDLNLGEGEGITFVSDQQKGIILAISTLLPYAEHRMCARHIWANLKKTCNLDEVRQLFWAASKSYTQMQLSGYMEQLKTVSIEAYNVLEKHNARHWSRAFFSTLSKCDCVDNNFSESFNSIIREARRKPVVQMLESIRQNVMLRNARKLEAMQSHVGLVTPKAKALIDVQKDVARTCKVFNNRQKRFEVSHKGCTFAVSFHREYCCSCRYYDLSGIPCGHIMAAVWDYNRVHLPADIVSADCWTTERWKNTYSSVLQPVNGMKLWARTTDVSVIPPPNRIMPGRPKKNDRRKEPGESSKKKGVMTCHGRTMTCSHCQCEGHNARGCPKKSEPPVPPKEKGIRGRPRIHPKDTQAGTSSKRKTRTPDANIPTQDTIQITQPSQISSGQQEGFGVIYNALTGDMCFGTGTSLIDMRNNTILSTTLQAERDNLLRRPRDDTLDL